MFPSAPLTVRSRSTAAMVAVAAVLALLAVACAASSRGPQLVPGESVAEDFADLALGTFADFLTAAPAVAQCTGDIRLEAAESLDDLAVYSAATATITVRVPATAPSLRDSLVHELAHHVEASCPSHEQVREVFLAAQGHDPATDWFSAGAWERTPSEEYAEAVVTVVLGQRRRHLGSLRLTEEAVQVVATWLDPE